jgi:hypothetical protein
MRYLNRSNQWNINYLRQLTRKIALAFVSVQSAALMLSLICLSEISYGELSLSPTEPTINQDVTLTSTSPVAIWSVTTGASGTDFSTPVTSVSTLKTTILKHGKYIFQATMTSGNTESKEIEIVAPTITSNIENLVQLGQGILPNSQITEIAKITLEATGIPSDNLSNGRIPLMLQDLQVEIKANGTEKFSSSLISAVYLYAYNDPAAADEEQNFTLNYESGKIGQPEKELTLVDISSTPTGNIFTVSGNGLNGMIASSGNRIYMKDDGSGFSKTYFVAIATSSQWLSGNSIKISVNKPTNTLPLTNFSQFKGTGSSIIENHPTGFETVVDMEFNILNLVNTGYTLPTGSGLTSSGNTNRWPKANPSMNGADIRSWVDGRYTPQWSETTPPINSTGSFSSSGFPLIGGSCATPIYAIVGKGGTLRNPALLSAVEVVSFTRDWLDATGQHGFFNLLKTGAANSYGGLAVYKDDGDGVFDEKTDTVIGGGVVYPQIRNNTPSTTLSGLNHISYNFFGGSATRPLGFQYQTAESNFTNYVSTFIGQGLQASLGYNESLNLNSKLDPVNPANSTYFVVLRTTVNVDDGDSQVNVAGIMSPVGSSFQTFLGNVIVLPPNSLTGNVQYGKCVTELDERTTGVNLKTSRYQQTVATVYNLAMVGYVPDNNYWPNMELYGRNDVWWQRQNIMLHNYTPEAIFGVDLTGTDDTVAKSHTSEIIAKGTINEEKLNYLYRFSGLRVAVTNNTNMACIANLSNDMLSGISLWKDHTGKGQKGRWDAIRDLIIDEDGITTGGAGLKDYSLEDFKNRKNSDIYNPYASVKSDLKSFAESDHVYYEDADLTGEYSLGESLFIDANANGQHDVTELANIIYNRQKLNVKNPLYLGFSGSGARPASKSNVLRYSDIDGNGKYGPGDIIIWDGDLDHHFTPPTEIWVRPKETQWETRTVAAANWTAPNILNITISATVWNTNKWAAATVEFNDNSLWTITNNGGNNFTCTYLSGGTNDANGKTNFWILQADVVADVNQEVYDYNFPGKITSTTLPRYDGTTAGYDYFMALRPLYQNPSILLSGIGNNPQLTVKANGLLLDPINGYVATPQLQTTALISPPTSIEQAPNLGEKIGVSSKESDPLALMALDLVSGNTITSTGSANYTDILTALNVELYNRNGFSYQSDLEDLSLTDNAQVGAYSGLSLWMDQDNLTSSTNETLSSSAIELIVQVSGKFNTNTVSNQLDPNGRKTYYLTLGNFGGIQEVVGYNDAALIGGNLHFMGLSRGQNDTTPMSWSKNTTVIAGRNGIFDPNVDINVPLSSSPYASGGSGTATMLKMDINNTVSSPFLGATIGANNLGANAGPDFFVCLRTSSRISNEDSFALGLIQWINFDNGPFQATYPTGITDNNGTGIWTANSSVTAAISYYGHGKTKDVVVDSEAPVPVTALSGARGDGYVNLSWTSASDSTGSLVVRRTPSQTGIIPNAATSYFPGSFIKSYVVYDGASVSTSSNIITVNATGITLVNVTNGGFASVGVGDYVVIRSGINRGYYIIHSKTLDGSGSGVLGLNKSLQADSLMSLEVGNGLVLMSQASESFIDSQLDNGSGFAYDVYTYDEVNNYSSLETVNIFPASLSLTPPSPASDGKVTNGNGTVKLEWTNPIGTGLDYLVLASSSPIAFTPTNGLEYTVGTIVKGGGVVKRIDLASSGTKVAVDASLLTNSKKYYFHIYIRDAVRNYSTELKLEGSPTADIVAPTDALNLTQSTFDGITTLKWIAPSTSDLNGYALISSDILNDINLPNLLTPGKNYGIGDNVQNGGSKIAAQLEKTITTYSAYGSGNVNYRIFSYDQRPNYSLGVRPTMSIPMMSMVDMSSRHASNRVLDLTTPVEKNMAEWTLNVADDGLILGSIQLHYPSTLIGTPSANVSMASIYLVEAGSNILLGSNTLVGTTSAVIVPIAPPLTPSANYLMPRTQPYTFRATFNLSSTANAGDNFMLSEVTVTGTGNLSGATASSNIRLSTAPEFRRGIADVTVSQGSPVGPYTTIGSGNSLLNLVATAGSFETVKVESVSFYVQPTLFAASANILVNGVINTSFVENTSKSIAGNVFFDVIGGMQFNPSSATTLTLWAKPSGNVGETVTASFNALLFSGFKTGSTGLLAQGSAKDQLVLKGDGLTVSNFVSSTEIHLPNSSSSEYTVSSFDVTGGGKSLITMTNMKWAMKYSTGFDVDRLSGNVTLYRDSILATAWSSSSSAVGQLNIVNDIAERVAYFDISTNSGNTLTSFDYGTTILPDLNHRYFLRSNFNFAIAGGHEVTFSLNAISANVITSASGTFTSKGPAEIGGVDKSKTSKVQFQTGTLSAGLATGFKSSSQSIFSTSDNVLSLKINLTATGETLQMQSLTFNDLKTSNSLGQVYFELQTPNGNVFTQGVTNQSQLIFTDFSGLSGGNILVSGTAELTGV